MSFNREFSDRFHRNQSDSHPTRFRPNFRGRGPPNQHFRSQRRGSHFRQNYRQLVNDFSHQSIDSSISQTNVKPKYETIILELDDNSKNLSEDTLRQHFQQNYGSIKKVWFNNTRSKAFITFYNHMSVDMCLESGVCVQIKGLSVKVEPLPVTIPPELMSTNEDISFQLNTLCKSNNRNLKAKFPSREGSDQQIFTPTLNRRQLLNLVQIERIDEKKLLDDILNAKDIKEQMNVLFDTVLLKDSDLQKRIQLKDYLEKVLNLNGFECRLHFFGSTVNGLGFRDSDIDIFIETFNVKQNSFEETMDSLKTIHKILKRALKMFIPNPIASHRCPIVRLVFGEIPYMKDSKTEALICDLNMSNGLGVRNSHLIRYYCRLEPRFQQLCLLLRFWAKVNGFIGSSHMSSYAFTHLVVFFCQKEKLLPTVDYLRQVSTTEPIVIKGWDSSFCDDIECFSENQQNTDSILELLEKFFTFYANFDFSHLIISTKIGSTKLKSEISLQMDTNSEEVLKVPNESFKLTPILSIEDPFELTHNLCANLNYKTFDKFCDYLSHICCNFKQLFVDKYEDNSTIAEEPLNNSETVFWGLSQLCREWDPTPNGYAFPEQCIGFANLDLILNEYLSQSPKDLMQIMANRLTDLTDIWLSKVYRIESILLSKYNLICGQLSPFAEFYIKVRALDNLTTDSTTRQEFKQKFTEEELKDLSFTERETQITDRIHRQFYCDVNNSSVIPIECQFALVMNCRIGFPTLELIIIDFKPGFESRKALSNFLRRMIATAANDSRILTCPHELIS